MYVYYKRNTCLYYVCILHTVILCNNKKIIHHSNQGEWMEIGDKGGECTQAYFCICNHFMYYSSILFLEGCVRLHGHWLLYGLHVDLCMKYAKKLCPLRWYSKSLIIYSKKRSQKDMNNNLLLVLIGYRLNWVRE